MMCEIIVGKMCMMGMIHFRCGGILDIENAYTTF